MIESIRCCYRHWHTIDHSSGIVVSIIMTSKCCRKSRLGTSCENVTMCIAVAIWTQDIVVEVIAEMPCFLCFRWEQHPRWQLVTVRHSHVEGRWQAEKHWRFFCDICDVRESLANIAIESRATCIGDDPELEQLSKDLLNSIRKYRVTKRSKSRNTDSRWEVGRATCELAVTRSL